MIADPRRVDLARLAAEAQLARVTIYALHLEVPVFEAAQDRVSPTLVRDRQVRGDGLARVAGAARGAVFRLVGDDPRPFARIARELSGYYLLAFEPLDAERDGRPHRIRVRLSRGGGELRARPGFVLPAGVAADPRRDAGAIAAGAVAGHRAAVARRDLCLCRAGVARPARGDQRRSRRLDAGRPGLRADRRRRRDCGDRRSRRQRWRTTPSVPSFRRATTRCAWRRSTRLAGRVRSAARSPRSWLAAGGVRISDLMLARVPARPQDPLAPLIDRVSTNAVIAYLELHADDRVPLPDAVRIVVTSAADDRALVTVPAYRDPRRRRVGGGPGDGAAHLAAAWRARGARRGPGRRRDRGAGGAPSRWRANCR